MVKKDSALVIGQDEQLCIRLKEILEQIGIRSEMARTYDQACTMLQKSPPELIFSQTSLPDATWSEVVSLASQAPRPVQVIVFSPVVDYELFIDAMEGGAADCIMPPFEVADIAWMVCGVRQQRSGPERSTEQAIA